MVLQSLTVGRIVTNIEILGRICLEFRVSQFSSFAQSLVGYIYMFMPIKSSFSLRYCGLVTKWGEISVKENGHLLVISLFCSFFILPPPFVIFPIVFFFFQLIYGQFFPFSY